MSETLCVRHRLGKFFHSLVIPSQLLVHVDGIVFNSCILDLLSASAGCVCMCVWAGPVSDIYSHIGARSVQRCAGSHFVEAQARTPF